MCHREFGRRSKFFRQEVFVWYWLLLDIRELIVFEIITNSYKVLLKAIFRGLHSIEYELSIELLFAHKFIKK